MDNNRTITLLVAVIALLAGVAITSFSAGDDGADSDDTNTQLQAAVDSMTTQMTQMREQISALTQQVEAGGEATLEPTPAVRRDVTQEQIDRMVAAAIAKQADYVLAVMGDEELTEEQKAAARKKQIEEAYATLLGPDVDGDDIEKVWAELAEAGLLEEAIAYLEEQAELYPENEDLQFQLGVAYLQPMNHGNVAGAEAGQWAMKADGTFDRILKSNPENWEARFTKAVSYSFWPPVFGKQQAAIDHFEILVGQQANQASNPKFAQTHLMLGNLYFQTGQGEKAKETWSNGLAQYPEDAELRKQLGLE